MLVYNSVLIITFNWCVQRDPNECLVMELMQTEKTEAKSRYFHYYIRIIRSSVTYYY